MYEKITAAIEKHAAKHRLVIWYDPEGAHRAVLDNLTVDASVLEVANNELAVKYRVLLQEPDRHFVIYAPYDRPADERNWLLDLVLAGFPFTTNLVETYREELGLPVSLRSFVADHAAFFENQADRLQPLSELISPETETESSLAIKMMSVLVGPDADARRSPERFQWSLFALIEEAVEAREERWQRLCRFGLDGAWRDALGMYLPTVPDDLEPGGAAIEILRLAWDSESENRATQHQRNCRYLLGEWRNRYAREGRYAPVVVWAQKALGIPSQLSQVSLEELRRRTVFPAVEQEIASRLIQEANSGRADWTRIHEVARERMHSFWVDSHLQHLRPVFILLQRIVEFEQALTQADLSPADAETLVNRYVGSLYPVDQLYRQLQAAAAEADVPGALAEIVDRIEGRYVHQFLQPLSEIWDRTDITDGMGIPLQQRFFETLVAPYLAGNDKVVVIIADALRYEAGEELSRRVQGLNRVQATLNPMIGTAPTVTAVGMNALLPHGTLHMNAQGTCLIDGKNVQGIEHRSAYLSEVVVKRFPGKRAGAFKMNEILDLPVAAARERFSGLDVVYLYSDRIDATADNFKTEHLLPLAAQEELSHLTAMVKKIGNQLNRTHLIITADHGFLYQRDELVEAHKLAAEKPADGNRWRRFILGYDPEAVGEAGEGKYRLATGDPAVVDSEQPIAFAAGLYRIRKHGGGSRYVHGGLTLQERIVPLIRVRLTRTDDVKPVSVSIMKPTNAVITTPTYTVRFYQEQAVSEKRPALTLVGFFCGVDEKPISDTVEVLFDSPDSADQNRGRSVEFHFGPGAVQSNGQDITLVLKQKVGGAMVDYAVETFRYQTIGERDF